MSFTKSSATVPYHPKNHAMARMPWRTATTIVSRARLICQGSGTLAFPFMIMNPRVAVPMRQRNRILPATMIMGNVIHADNAINSRHIHHY